MSHVIRWVRYPHPQSRWSMVIVRATELNNKNIYVLQIGVSLCNKLGQLYFIRNKGNCCYKLGQLDYYKLGQVFLQFGTAVTN